MFGKDKKSEPKITEMGVPKKNYPISSTKDDINELLNKLNANLQQLQAEQKKEVDAQKDKEVKSFKLGLTTNIELTKNGINALKEMQNNTTATPQQLKILEKIEAGLNQESRTRAMISKFFAKIKYISETPHTFKLERKSKAR